MEEIPVPMTERIFEIHVDQKDKSWDPRVRWVGPVVDAVYKKAGFGRGDADANVKAAMRA